MPLYKSRKGDWRWEFQYRNQRYTGAGHKTRKEGLEAREKKRREAKGGSIPIGMAFEEAANLYLDFSHRRHATKTYNYKKLVYKRFKDYHGNSAIQDITPFMIHSFLATRPSNRNYNAHLAELSALFTFCKRQLKTLILNPCFDMEYMPHTPKKPELPTEANVLKLLLAADPDTQKPLLLILLHTLARIDEILRLTWQDINFENHTITLWTRKRRGGSYQPDILPMNEDLYHILWSLWQRKTQNHWVIYNHKTQTRYTRRPKMMRGICKQAKIKPFGFHSLRHFVASYLADKEKISKKTISTLLRHREMGTTEIYLQSPWLSQISALKSLEGRF